MAVQIYNQTFNAHRRFSFDSKEDLLAMALEKANEFFIKHSCFDIINIVESWSFDGDECYLTIYYKDYI